MRFLLNHPVLLFLVTFAVLWIFSRFGIWVRRRRPPDVSFDESDFSLILGATLTLLGLLTGFTFSMAVGRYDQRKNYEEEEANAIGTEYVRADLLPAVEAAKVRALLREYLDQRILFYTTADEQLLRQKSAAFAQVQSSLWSAVAGPANAQPNAVAAVTVTGMNDVLNRQGYTAAAWRNRVPVAAWLFVLAIAILCDVLLGYHAHGKSRLPFLVLPIALSISFFLIADIDSPRGGIIRVRPQNLEALADSLRPQ